MSITKAGIVLLSALAAACSSPAPRPNAPGPSAPGPNAPGPSAPGSSAPDPVATSCVAPGDDGSRAGYHFAGDTKWLADCDTPLRREYWRVFLSADSTAYLMPRPDGYLGVAKLCGATDPAVRSAAERATLCSESPSVKRVNALTPTDARTIARALHGTLRFEAEGPDVLPFAIPSDIADACRTERPDNLKTLCDRAMHPGGDDIALRMTEAEAKQVAEMMNRLYGIS